MFESSTAQGTGEPEAPAQLPSSTGSMLPSGRNPASYRILIVEDDQADLGLIKRNLERGGWSFELLETTAAETALSVLGKYQPDCILLDNHLPSCSGLEFVARMSDRFGKDYAAVIMVTGDESQRTGIEAIKRGVQEFVAKADLPSIDLGGLIAKVLEARKLHQDAGRRVYTEKLASLSNLVAGAAHEINNPAAIARLTLSAVTEALGGLEASERTVEPKELHRLEELVRAADDALARIGAVVRSLERETGTSLGQIHQLTLDQAVQSAAPTIRGMLEADRKVVYRLESDDSFIGDIAQLARVVIDLVANALEATPPDGVVEVITRTDGDVVELLVDDDGEGVDKNLEDLVFEPLFTTRRSRGALGMGLARASAVVERHGGQIRVQRSPRGGARFEAIIPRVKGDMSPRSSSLIPRTRRVGEDHLRVLVVDDDPGIRASYERVLKMSFEVRTAAGAVPAFELIDEQRFDVILCDVIMPGEDGVSFAQQLRKRYPEQAESLLFCTGGVLEPEQEKFVSAWSNGYLRKPLSAEELTSCLRSFARARLEPLPLESVHLDP